MNPCQQPCTQPGYRQPLTNVHAVIGGYPQASLEITRKGANHRITNVHAVSRRLAAGLSATVFGYAHTLSKEKRVLRITVARVTKKGIRA